MDDENLDESGLDPKVKAYLQQAALNPNAGKIGDIAKQQADLAANNAWLQGMGKSASMMGAVGPHGTEAGNDVLDTTMPGYTKAGGAAANAQIGGLAMQDEARQKLYSSLAGAQQKQNQMAQQKSEFGQKMAMEGENARATRGLTASNQQFMHGQKEDQDFEKFGKDLNANLLSRGPTADQQRKLNSAASLNTLISSQPDYNKLTPQQVHELSIAAANLVSGGSGAAQQTIASVTPSGMQQDAASLEQYFNSAPQGANMGAFVKNLKDIADRESETSKNIVGQAVTQAASSYSHLKAKNPDRFNMMVKNNLGQYGVTPEDFDDNGFYHGQKFSPHPQNNPSNTAGNTKEQPRTLLDVGGQTAQGGSSVIPTSDDQKAISWLMENPSAPQAKAVRDSLVKRGLLQGADKNAPDITFSGK